MMMRFGFAVFFLMINIVACGPNDQSPQGTAQLFLRAAAIGDNTTVYSLLAEKNRQQLINMAQLATTQTGNRKRFKPEELLALSLAQPHFNLGKILGVKIQDKQAEVELVSIDGKQREKLTLLLEKGHWRVFFNFQKLL